MKNNQKQISIRKRNGKLDSCQRGGEDSDVWIRSFGSYSEATAMGTL